MRRFLFSLLDFLVGGSIGYVATYFALRRLYGSIRVD
jgi:transmembrane 9 superfamily protein 2/4